MGYDSTPYHFLEEPIKGKLLKESFQPLNLILIPYLGLGCNQYKSFYYQKVGEITSNKVRIYVINLSSIFYFPTYLFLL